MKNNDYAQTNCHYAPVKNESYYAQNYASIMCQALVITRQHNVPSPSNYT